MKARPRRRIDINLEELDQLIDRSMQAPLSASEGGKLKTAMHAMADRLLGKRNTEKTNAVLETPPTPASESTSSDKKVIPAGHGRHAAAAFTGADRVVVPHARYIRVIHVRSVRRERSTARKHRRRWCASWAMLR